MTRLAPLLLAGHLTAATSVLDCIGDAAAERRAGRWQGDGRTLALDGAGKIAAIQFRSTSLKGWRARGAKLVVHFASGRCEQTLLAGYLAKFDEKAESPRDVPAPETEAACSEAGAGWWQIDLPAAIAQRLVDEPNGAILLTGAGKSGPVIHARETVSFAPRLLVEGLAP